MFTIGLIFVVMCIVPDTIWCGILSTSSTVTGLSPWCTELDKNLKLKSEYPSVPARCCGSNNICKKVIGAKMKNYGLKNEGSWPIRLCSCEQDFYTCIVDPRDGIGELEITLALARSNCFRPKQCRVNEICETDDYEMVNSAQGVRRNYDNSGNEITDEDN